VKVIECSKQCSTPKCKYTCCMVDLTGIELDVPISRHNRNSTHICRRCSISTIPNSFTRQKALAKLDEEE